MKEYAIEVIFGMIFIAISMTILMGGIKNVHRAATEITVAEFEKNKSRLLAIMCPVIGFLLIGIILLRSPDPEKEPVYHGIAIGAGAILYGLYRWYRIKHEK